MDTFQCLLEAEKWAWFIIRVSIFSQMRFEFFLGKQLNKVFLTNTIVLNFFKFPFPYTLEGDKKEMGCVCACLCVCVCMHSPVYKWT